MRTLIRLAGIVVVAAFAGDPLGFDRALAQTRCPEGRTASGACVIRGLAKAMRDRAIVFTQPKLSYTGVPVSQNRSQTQDTVTPRSIERNYDQYGVPPPQPVPVN